MKIMDGKKIVIGPSTFGETDRRPLERLCDAGYDVVENPFKRKLTKEELIGLLSDKVVGLIAGLETVDREVMEKSKLKVVSRCGSGMSNVDAQAARELGIRVYSTPDSPTAAVAELTMCALLSLVRSFPHMNYSMHQRKWGKRIGVQLSGKNIAIIGFGRIGRKVAQLVRAFGAHVVAVDPALSGTIDGVTVVDCDTALKKADIVALHASGDRPLLGEREFKLLKKGAYVLNAARGGLIDEKELAKAIDRGQVAGAWLDTFAEEPYTGPLCDYENVILTPHVGSYTLECRRQMELESVKNLLAGLHNE